MDYLTNLISNIITPIISGIDRLLPIVLRAIVIFVIGVLVIRVIDKFARNVVQMIRMPAGLRGILVSLLNGILWMLLVIIILSILGFSDVIIFFSSSVAALGLLMAAGGSTLVSDIIAGIFLAQDRNFRVGDLVQAGETPTEGIVVSMDMRRIRLRDNNGKLHVLPNSVVERKEWVVLATRAELAAQKAEKKTKTK